MAKRLPPGAVETVAEAFGGSSPEGSKRFWQGRRARGRLAKLARESGGEDARFGRTTFPLAPPLPGGYTEGGGGVAGVPELLLLEDGALLEPNLTNAERAWLTDHDMPIGTPNRIVVLRRVQLWDAEIATRLSRLRKQSPELDGGPSSSPTLPFEISKASSTRLWEQKRKARTRPKTS